MLSIYTKLCLRCGTAPISIGMYWAHSSSFFSVIFSLTFTFSHFVFHMGGDHPTPTNSEAPPADPYNTSSLNPDDETMDDEPRNSMMENAQLSSAADVHFQTVQLHNCTRVFFKSQARKGAIEPQNFGQYKVKGKKFWAEKIFGHLGFHQLKCFFGRR
eukprot:g32541.t1